MITNKTRAVLIQPGEYRIRGGYFEEVYCDGHWECGDAPEYDTDANAVAELRAFVRARGKDHEFICHLMRQIGVYPMLNEDDSMNLLDATPQQQTAAFDIVFKTDLERINET